MFLNRVGFQVRQIDKAVGKMEDMFGEEGAMAFSTGAPDS